MAVGGLGICRERYKRNFKAQSSNAKCKIIAVEQDKRSKPFNHVKYEFPVAIVVGNETNGISKEVLDMSDMIVEMPMWGINKSFNVMVSCGIIFYEIMEESLS